MMRTLLRFPFTLLLAGLMIVSMGACDSNEVSEDDLEGVWRLLYVEENGVKDYADEGEDIFFVFKSDEFVLYMDFGECYFKVATPITDRDGDNWETDEGTVEVKLDGDELSFIDDDGAKTVLEKSTRSESSFTPLCDGMSFKGTPSGARLLQSIRAN